MVKNINKNNNCFPLQANEHKIKYPDGKPGFGYQMYTNLADLNGIPNHLLLIIGYAMPV
jgi:hypothetical protein